MKQNFLDFIRTNTNLSRLSLVPEIKLHMESDITRLWHITENDLKQKDIDPPFWAFAWPGGQAIPLYLLDNPLVIKNKYVLDLASSSGTARILALLASARHVDFNEIDPLACKTISLNITANGLNLSPSILEENLISKTARRHPKKTVGRQY